MSAQQSELRVDNESVVTNASGWFDGDGERENQMSIRCHGDRVVSPFANGTFVLQASAVDNDVIVSRAGDDAFEYSEIRSWNESAIVVTYSLRNLTAVEEASEQIAKQFGVPFTVDLVEQFTMQANCDAEREWMGE